VGFHRKPSILGYPHLWKPPYEYGDALTSCGDFTILMVRKTMKVMVLSPTCHGDFPWNFTKKNMDQNPKKTLGFHQELG